MDRRLQRSRERRERLARVDPPAAFIVQSIQSLRDAKSAEKSSCGRSCHATILRALAISASERFSQASGGRSGLDRVGVRELNVNATLAACGLFSNRRLNSRFTA